jgi:hypothetical protein
MIGVKPMTKDDVRAAVRKGFVCKELAKRLELIPDGGQYCFGNGSPHALGGITVAWDGVGVAWLSPSKEIKKNKFAFFRAATEALAKAIVDFDLHRVHCEVKTTDRVALKFALLLGFEREATMKKYGPDKSDYHLMTWLR